MQDNLTEDGVFAVLVYDSDGSIVHIFLWVGSDSLLTCERDKEILEVAHEFMEAKEIPATVEVCTLMLDVTRLFDDARCPISCY